MRYKATTELNSLARGGTRILAGNYVTEISFNPDTWAALIREGAIVEVSEETTAVHANAEANATDSAIELADEHGLQLWSVTGSGKNGRITLNDVRALVEDE